MKNTWFAEFQRHLDSVDENELKKEWAEIEKEEVAGPNAFEYIEYLCSYYSAKRTPCQIDSVEIPEKMTPNFSGSFFLLYS